MATDDKRGDVRMITRYGTAPNVVKSHARVVDDLRQTGD